MYGHIHSGEIYDPLRGAGAMGPTAGALVLALLQAADSLGLHAAKEHRKKHGHHKMSYGRMYRNEGCAPLDNKGTHFTIDVEVGTPGQRFSVVADTGSNTLIVPSCVCQQTGQCPQDGSEHCFTGTNKSSSFQVERDAAGSEPTSLVLTFGSGQIKGIVAKDGPAAACGERQGAGLGDGGGRK